MGITIQFPCRNYSLEVFMGFYNLTKEERVRRVEQISNDIFSDINLNYAGLK